jgi:acetyl-CoA synthetase
MKLDKDSPTESPEKFWGDQARILSWGAHPTKILSGDLKKGNVKWFEDGKLNACYNCVDRHLDKYGDKTAIIWESEDPNSNLSSPSPSPSSSSSSLSLSCSESGSRKITFNDLHKEVCRFANLLKSREIKKGDRVCIYMPMIPEATMAMLACARIGAIHSVVFGGFSPESIKSRVLDADCRAVITVDGSFRNGKLIPFKDNIDKALVDCPNVDTVINIKNTCNKVEWFVHRDIDYHEHINLMSDDCPCETMDACDPLFILYTSGSTGNPKGILHSVGGYLLYASYTHKFIFDIKPDDVYWCCADVGWITGHSYIVYGPLANATTSIMIEGNSGFPDSSRCFDIIDKYKVSIFYTSPTFIRLLMKCGNQNVKSSSRESLRILGSVGEPINPECWQWYFDVIGDKRCPIMDTWWQTETGGFMIAPPLDKKLQKPGFAQKPIPGISLALLDNNGKEIKGKGEGVLVISKPWPGMMLEVYKNHKRFLDVYLKPHPGYYFTGDGAKRDKDGDYCITGRVDDMINVSGHLLSTAEIEGALALNPKVIESAVVGVDHSIKGQAIYAFVTLVKNGDDITKDLQASVRSQLGPVVSIDFIQYADDLPKTRSGKIMRRILRKIANKKGGDLGDISTLNNPDCIEKLIKNS